MDDFFCLIIGIGIGGGIFFNGVLVCGGCFWVGEFGYMFSECLGVFCFGKYMLNEIIIMFVFCR